MCGSGSFPSYLFISILIERFNPVIDGWWCFGAIKEKIGKNIIVISINGVGSSN
jgi:hypothetical protein